MRKASNLPAKWRIVVFFLVALLVLAADQLSKIWVRSHIAVGQSLPEIGWLRLTHIRNTGAAFGLFQEQSFPLTVVGLLGIAFLLHHIVMGFVIGVSPLRMNWAAHGAFWGALFGVFLAISVIGTMQYPWAVFIFAVIWGFLIETLATKVYNADGVEYAPLANRKIRQFEQQGWGRLPINMAKTHLSLSHDPNLKGVPSDYTFPIRDIRPAIGAGFLYPLAGEMSTMPGLPSTPAAVRVDIDETGKTVGLF